MSRFDLNKFMMFVDGTTESLEDFCRDREGFVERWTQAADESERPVPNGGQLSDLEQAALIGLDVGALYEMGCAIRSTDLYEIGSHPYILLHFARAIEVDLNGVPFPEFDRAYKAAVTPHGYPNFAT